jgi:hypothetical protein
MKMPTADEIRLAADKTLRNGQTRDGNPARRKLEFAVVKDQLARRREKFIARLTSRLVRRGDCLCYEGTLDHKGYARMNFRYRGQHVSIHVHRLFLILKIGKPIPQGYESGHEKHCQHRTCVQHVSLEHYTSNAVTQSAEQRDKSATKNQHHEKAQDVSFCDG